MGDHRSVVSHQKIEAGVFYGLGELGCQRFDILSFERFDLNAPIFDPFSVFFLNHIAPQPFPKPFTAGAGGVDLQSFDG